MRSLIFGIFCLLLLSCSKNTENESEDLPFQSKKLGFVKTFGGSEEDIAHSVISTHDGGFAVVGNTQSTNGVFTFKNRSGSDIFLMKFNSFLIMEWVKTYGGSADDRGREVIQLADGSYVIAGYSKSSDGDASVNKGQHDNWIIKTDENGEIIWEKSFGFLGHDHAYNIIATADGGLFFNGFLDLTSAELTRRESEKRTLTNKHGVGEFWCHKIDGNGQAQWSNYFGGTNNDRSYDALETDQGDFILVGSTESKDFDITDPKGGYDMWIVKIDAKGELLWEQAIGGSRYDIGKAIIETKNGDYLAVGQSYSSDKDIVNPLGASDGIVAKISSKGVLKEVQNYGSDGFDTLNDIIELENGTLILAGSSGNQELDSITPLNNDLILFHVDFNDELLNTYRLGGDGLDRVEKITTNTQGKIIAVGSTTSKTPPFSDSKGGKDLFIAIWD